MTGNTRASTRQLLFEELEINLDEVPIEHLSNYTAVEYFLIVEDELSSDATNLEKVNRYIESFHHLSEAEDWQKASQITFFHLTTSNGDQELHWHLHDWGYFLEKVSICQPLLGNLQPRSEAVLLNSMANAYDGLGEFHNAIRYQQRHLEIAQEIGRLDFIAAALSGMGNAYQSLGDFQKAISCHEQALEIELVRGNFEKASGSLGNIGNAYFSLQEYTTAYQYYQQYLEIARRFNNRKKEATALQGIADCYRVESHYEEAIDHYKRSLAIVRELENRQLEASKLGNIGLTYKNSGDYSRALEYYNQAISLARDIGDRQCEATIIGNIGVVHKYLNCYQEAINFQKEALAICSEIGDREGEARAFLNLGNIYGEMNFKNQAYFYLIKSIFIYHDLQIMPWVKQMLIEYFSFLVAGINPNNTEDEYISKEIELAMYSEIMYEAMTEVLGVNIDWLNTNLQCNAIEEIVRIAIYYFRE